jgi:hypothetical protein
VFQCGVLDAVVLDDGRALGDDVALRVIFLDERAAGVGIRRGSAGGDAKEKADAEAGRA